MGIISREGGGREVEPPSSRVRDQPAPEWLALAKGIYIRRMVEGNGCSISLYRIDPGHRFARHDHAFPELGVILIGRCRFAIGEEERAMREGDAYYIPGGTPHGLSVPVGVPVVLMNVTAPLPPDVSGPTFDEVLEQAMRVAVRDPGEPSRHHGRGIESPSRS